MRSVAFIQTPVRVKMDFLEPIRKERPKLAQSGLKTISYRSRRTNSRRMAVAFLTSYTKKKNLKS